MCASRDLAINLYSEEDVKKKNPHLKNKHVNFVDIERENMTKVCGEMGEDFANKELYREHSTISHYWAMILPESGVSLEDADPLAFLSDPNLSSSDFHNQQIHITQNQNSSTVEKSFFTSNGINLMRN